MPLEKLRARAVAGTLVFPAAENMRHHKATFQAIETKQRNRNDKVLDTILGTITLPLPSELVDNLQVGYDQIELGGIGKELTNLATEGGRENAMTALKPAYDAANAFVTNILKDSSLAINDLIFAEKNLNPAGNSIVAGLFSAGVSKIGPVARYGIQKAFSVARNPHKEMIFNSVSLREHSFNYKLSPRNLEEATVIEKIVRFFRFNMLPSYSSNFAGNHFFVIPPEFEINFYNGLHPHPFIVKRSVLTAVTVNYHPYNYPAYVGSLRGSVPPGKVSPAELNLSLAFREIQVLTRENAYERNTAGNLGFAPDSSGDAAGGGA